MRFQYLNGSMWGVREYAADDLQAQDGRRAVVAVAQGRRYVNGTGGVQVKTWGGRK